MLRRLSFLLLPTFIFIYLSITVCEVKNAPQHSLSEITSSSKCSKFSEIIQPPLYNQWQIICALGYRHDSAHFGQQFGVFSPRGVTLRFKNPGARCALNVSRDVDGFSKSPSVEASEHLSCKGEQLQQLAIAIDMDFLYLVW